MKLIKILGAVLVSCAALVCVGVSAQTVPVSCSWTIVSAPFGPLQQTTIQKCTESNGAVVANRTLIFSAPFTSVPTCSLTTIQGVINSNYNCLSPSLVRAAAPGCNSGAFVAEGCAIPLTSSSNFEPKILQTCGISCTVTLQNLGVINGCTNSSPYLKVYCR